MTPNDGSFWDLIIMDEKHGDQVRTQVLIIDKMARTKRILVESRDYYEHIDACMNHGATRAVVLKMIAIPNEDEDSRNEYIEIYDPATIKPVLSMSNWPVNNIVFSQDGNRMYLQTKLENGMPVEVVLDLVTGDKVEGASRKNDGTPFVKIADLLRQRRRINRNVS